MFSTNRSAPLSGALVKSPWDQRLARALIRPLAGSPVTPNHITALSLIAGLAGALLFAQGGTAMHWGALLFILSTLLDHADGYQLNGDRIEQRVPLGVVFIRAVVGRLLGVGVTRTATYETL